jgi:hypothetical protein
LAEAERKLMRAEVGAATERGWGSNYRAVAEAWQAKVAVLRAELDALLAEDGDGDAGEVPPAADPRVRSPGGGGHA